MAKYSVCVTSPLLKGPGSYLHYTGWSFLSWTWWNELMMTSPPPGNPPVWPPFKIRTTVAKLPFASWIFTHFPKLGNKCSMLGHRYFHPAPKIFDSEQICIFARHPSSVYRDSGFSTIGHTCYHYKGSNGGPHERSSPKPGPPASKSPLNRWCAKPVRILKLAWSPETKCTDFCTWFHLYLKIHLIFFLLKKFSNDNNIYLLNIKSIRM